MEITIVSVETLFYSYVDTRLIKLKIFYTKDVQLTTS